MGACYVLTILDDSSRTVWVYLLKHKHEVSKSLINFCKMLKNQFGKGIKRVRSDNKGDFTSNSMNEFYT